MCGSATRRRLRIGGVPIVAAPPCRLRGRPCRSCHSTVRPSDAASMSSGEPSDREPWTTDCPTPARGAFCSTLGDLQDGRANHAAHDVAGPRARGWSDRDEPACPHRVRRGGSPQRDRVQDHHFTRNPRPSPKRVRGMEMTQHLEELGCQCQRRRRTQCHGRGAQQQAPWNSGMKEKQLGCATACRRRTEVASRRPAEAKLDVQRQSFAIDARDVKGRGPHPGISRCAPPAKRRPWHPTEK